MRVRIKTMEELEATPGAYKGAIGLYGPGGTCFLTNMEKIAGKSINVSEIDWYEYKYDTNGEGMLAEWMVVRKEDIFDKLYLTLKSAS